MWRFSFVPVTCLAALLACYGAGCNTATPPAAPGDDHGHGHEHAHDHAHHGPHGGHIIEIGEEEYHAEWTHDEDGKITVYLLDGEMKKDVPIPSEKITIDVKVGENPPQTFELLAVDRAGEPPMAARFEIVDKGLLGVLEALSKGVTATLNVEIGGKPYQAKIEPDEHKH